jgi:hypothetical protein
MNPLDLLSGITPIVNKVLDLIPDPNAKARAEAEMQAELLKYAAAQDAQQADINKAEASNPSLWVSGARPFILWTCGVSFAFAYVFAPIVVWTASLYGKTFPLPQFDKDMMQTLMYALLGLGSMRSFDKWKGVAAK